MFRSLRVRLPLVFLAGLVLAGVITTLIAVRLFQSLAHDQTLTRAEPRGARRSRALYTEAIPASYGNNDKAGKSNDRSAPRYAAATLEQATGDKIYFIGGRNGLFPGQITGLRRLPLKTIDWSSGKSLSFEFTPPGTHRVHLAVANPIYPRHAAGRRDRRRDDRRRTSASASTT